MAIRQHLEACEPCREELQRYRKLAVLMSRVPRAVPPADLAVKIKVAAAQAQPTQDWSGRWQSVKDRTEILVDNVFRPLTVPATGGFFSAIVIFVFVFHMMLPGITVQADPNDVPTALLRPAELISLSNMPASAEMQHPDVALQHELLVDVVVDAQGRPTNIRVANSLGMGLDEKAIEAARKWRFEPAMKDNHPVAVEIALEVDFHLY